jgi:hypothetical protein
MKTNQNKNKKKIQTTVMQQIFLQMQLKKMKKMEKRKN